MLIVIRELENWKHLLESTKYKFEVWTNCKNLEQFMKAQKLNRKQACQALYLSRYDFTLKHVLGTKIGKVDRLSRRLDWKVEIEKDNENKKLIKEEQIQGLIEVAVERLEVDMIKKIKKAREKNNKVVRVVEKMKKAEVKVLRDEEWQVDNLVLKERKIYVLNSGMKS